MLETLIGARWPDRDSNAEDQVHHIWEWSRIELPSP